MILRFDNGVKCCCDKRFPICTKCDEKRRRRYRGGRDTAKNSTAFELKQIAKLEQQEQRRKQVQSGWLKEHGYEQRA